MWHTKQQTILAPTATTESGVSDTTMSPTSSALAANLIDHHNPPFESSYVVPPLAHQQTRPNTTASAVPPQLQIGHQHPPARMVNRLKSLVSKNKKRFQADGFDLDLSYISPRIIAMGFPAERIEGLYRNHIDEVSRFFEIKHKGHYKIYHLCNERDFNEYRFSGPVVRYPFSDHNAPQFEQILALCQDVIQFLNQHPDNVVAINCKAGKGRTGVMVCACLMELQEAGNAEEALRLYAEQRTRNGKGVTIPSQRRYVQYYSRLHTAQLTYEPTPLRLTSIRIEGLPHQLHSVQNFELRISTYENRLSPVNCNHEHASSSIDDLTTTSTTTTSATTMATLVPSSHSHVNSPVVNASSAAIGAAAPTSAASPSGVSSAGPAQVDDYDFHRQTDVTTYQIPCSTHHSDSSSGSYLIRLDEPVTVFEDFRIKLKAKSGVLTKKIGQCWLNTFFILLDDDGNTSAPNTATTQATTSMTQPQTMTSAPPDYSSTSDSNSGSGSSSDSSASTASSTSSSVRNSPPNFTDLHHDHADGDIDVEDIAVDDVEDEKEEEELPTLTSNSIVLDAAASTPMTVPSTATSAECTIPTSATSSRRTSYTSFWFGGGKTGEAPPLTSLPKESTTNTTVPPGVNSFGHANFTKKNSPNMSTQLATPLAVRVLELSQSDLDAAFKGRGKKGEEFKVYFEFVRETPCSQRSNPLPLAPQKPPYAAESSGGCATEMEVVDELHHHYHQDLEMEHRHQQQRPHLVKQPCIPTPNTPHRRPFHASATVESSANQTGALVS